MKRLEGKTALITGAARGLGAAIARRFVEEGARVALNDVNSTLVAETARALDGLAVVADVSDSAAVKGMVETCEQQLGGLDVLVNNAGISGLEDGSEKLQAMMGRATSAAMETLAGGPVQTHLDATIEITDDEWSRMLAVHLSGTFFCTRESLRLMMKRNRGSIINIASIMGTAGGAGAAAYSAAKGGILGLTRAVALDVVTRNIRVNAIAPGYIETDMTAPLESLRRGVELRTPMGRFGDVDDIAWAAVYLASEEAKFMTGQVISPNGGYYMSQ